MVCISLVLNTCVRNAAEKKAGLKLNKWSSPFQFFILRHLPFLPCTFGQLLKADGAFRESGSQRVLPLLFLVTKIRLLCSKICSYLTADYFLPGLPDFSLFFLEVIQNTAVKPLPMLTLTDFYLSITSQPPGDFWSLLGSTDQQCQMCCQHGLLVGLCPALAFPSDFSCPEPAPPSWLPPASMARTLQCLCV